MKFYKFTRLDKPFYLPKSLVFVRKIIIIEEDLEGGTHILLDNGYDGIFVDQSPEETVKILSEG